MLFMNNNVYFVHELLIYIYLCLFIYINFPSQIIWIIGSYKIFRLNIVQSNNRNIYVYINYVTKFNTFAQFCSKCNKPEPNQYKDECYKLATIQVRADPIAYCNTMQQYTFSYFMTHILTNRKKAVWRNWMSIEYFTQ